MTRQLRSCGAIGARVRVASALLCLLGHSIAPSSSEAQTNPGQARQYYAVEDLAIGRIVRRGQAPVTGIPSGELILAPNARYRHWVFSPGDGLVGFADYGTPSAGNRFVIPRVSLGRPQTGDSDGDGLADIVEFVLGTDALNKDTDGDGITDGAAVQLGLDAGRSQTGIVGSTDTPGSAVDVCAANDVAVVADGEPGVGVFNIFNRMVPLRIAQVDTPGLATSVACSGNFVVVADGPAGIAVVDISDPPNARIVLQGGVAGNARAVAAIGDLAFVGTTEGTIALVDLASQSVVQRVSVGGTVYDLGVYREHLFAVVSSELVAYRFSRGPLEPAGRVGLSSFGPEGITGRRRLFVGSETALVTSYPGFDVVDIRDPAAMRVLGVARDAGPNSFKQIVDNGNRVGVATVGANPRDDGTHNVSLYDLSDPATTTDLMTTFQTPSLARSVALYNGLAYVADSAAGLHVINYLALDTGGRAPAGTLRPSLEGAEVVEGGRMFFSADVTDDVQVRNVEFLVDGVKAATDGSFPFVFGLRAPSGRIGGTVRVSAVARDTGGNETNLGPLTYRIVPDNQPPVVLIDQPNQDSSVLAGDLVGIGLTLFDTVGVDPDSLEFLVDGESAQAYRVSLTEWNVVAPLRRGAHELVVRARDFAGNEALSEARRFRVQEEFLSREWVVFNFGAEGLRDVLSRELSLFNFAEPARPEAIARELSVFNTGLDDKREALSREVSVRNE